MLSSTKKLADANKLNSYSGHLGPVYRLAADGLNGFYSAGSDGFLVHWKLGNPDNGNAILKSQTPIFAIESHDDTLYAGTFDGKIITNKTFNAQRPGSIFGIEVINDNLVCIGKNGDFSVYSLSDNQFTYHSKISNENLRCITLHPCLPLAVVSGSDGKIRLLETSNMREIDAYHSHKSSVFALAFSKCGSLLYSAGRDAHIKVFEFQTMNLLHDIPAHFFSINDIKLIMNDNYLASASMDKTIRIWRTADMKLIKVIDFARNGGHTAGVNALLWNPNTETLISAGEDKNIFEWNIEPYV